MTLITATTASKNPLPDPINDFFTPRHFPQPLSDIINEYVMRRPNCFGGTEFRIFFGVDVGNPVLPYDEFVSWWNDFDAVDLAEKVENPRRNCDTHSDPIFRPERIRALNSDEEQAYNLETLTRHAARPLGGGHSTIIYQENAAFEVHATTLAGPACWLLLRRDVLARNQSDEEGRAYIERLNREHRAAYEPSNTVINLATVAAVPHVVKGTRHFGDSTGIEGCCTSVRSGSRVYVGYSSSQSVVGAFSPYFGLNVMNFSGHLSPSVATAALRKFSEVLDTSEGSARTDA